MNPIIIGTCVYIYIYIYFFFEGGGGIKNEN